MPKQAFTVQQEWLKLDREQTRITAAEVIEQASDRLGDPTHAVLMDGWFYVSANVGWSKVDDNTGRLKEGASFFSACAPAFCRANGGPQRKIAS
jgi:hypothetical protein